MHQSIRSPVDTRSDVGPESPDRRTGAADAKSATFSGRWQRPAPEAIRRLDALVNADYSDLFTVAPLDANAKSPEGWAQALFGEAPAGLRQVIWVIQRWLLGFRLDSQSSAEHILGWRTAESGEDFVILETTSRMMTPHLLFKMEADRVLVATLIRYERWPAGLVWPPIAITVHRLVGMALARRAVRRQARAGL